MQGSDGRASWTQRARGHVRTHGWLAVVAAAALVLTRTIDFDPPAQVRLGQGDLADLVGDAPAQEFSSGLSNPQTVQLRATLRRYADSKTRVGEPDPEVDASGQVLSQPVITTIYGMAATMDQTIRLDGGKLEVDVALRATPRLAHASKRGKRLPPVVLEHVLMVSSRRRDWWRPGELRRVHLDVRGFLDKVDEHGWRVVFAVDEHLFSIDVELHRAATVIDASLARTTN